ncbi:hypothetical protein [Maliponia aquimaris]|nr:hypothetical protein [Maliponia aquimaris]
MSDSGKELELVKMTKRNGLTKAVDAVSHHFKHATCACLLGLSSCGKSSTLRMIADADAAKIEQPRSPGGAGGVTWGADF